MRRLEKLLITAAAFVVVVAGLRAAAGVAVPFLLAIFIAIITTPLYAGMRQRGLSTLTSMIVLLLLLIVTGMATVNIISGSVREFTSKVPVYKVQLVQQQKHLAEWLDSKGIDSRNLATDEQFISNLLLRYAGSTAAAVSALLGQAFLIFILVAFIFLEIAILPAKVRSLPGLTETTWQGLQSVVDDVRRYMGIKTITSLLTGFIIWLWAILLHLDHAVLLGLLAFFLNYVPSIGSIIASIPGILLALIQLGPRGAIFCAAGYFALNTVISSFLEPRFMGKGLGLSPLVILISLFFWGWVLGPVGMLLSVPLTMAAKIVLQGDEETRWIALLLGSGAPPQHPKAPPVVRSPRRNA